MSRRRGGGGLRRLLTPTPEPGDEATPSAPTPTPTPRPPTRPPPTGLRTPNVPAGHRATRRAIDAQPSVEQLVRISTAGTAVFVVAAGLDALRPAWFAWLGVGVSGVLFLIGCAAFIVGYARAVGRSRVDELDLPGLFFLVGSTDAAVRRRLVLLLVVQVVAGLAAAAARPFTPVAFCTLTPVFGLGALGLCGATHGRFPRRVR